VGHCTILSLKKIARLALQSLWRSMTQTRIQLFSLLCICAHLASASYAKIAGYEPGSSVVQHSRIDLDQKEMESHLGSVPAFDKAYAIYSQGGNSGGYARFTISSLASEVKKGVTVTQGSNTGVVKKTASAQATQLDVAYTSTCKVGGTSSPDNSGCFSATDELTIGSIKATPSAVVNKYRTLAGFSTAAPAKMQGQALYEQNTRFWKSSEYDYIDATKYGDSIVSAALKGTGGFKGKSNDWRIEMAKKGSAYMNVWQYVARELYDAVDDCTAGCIDCNDDPGVHAWDEGWAFYAGSLEGTDGNSAGKLLYRLAQKRCSNFGTCDTDGTAKINKELLLEFNAGQAKLQAGKCSEAPAHRDKIISLMSVPLIQGALRYAYKVAKLQGKDKEKAEGWAFAGAILGRVHHCSASAASTIKKNMAIDAETPMGDGYKTVKEAFESVYDCLGITCAHVGGLVLNDDYYTGAEPCTDGAPSPSPSPDQTEVNGATTSLITFVCTFFACIFLPVELIA